MGTLEPGCAESPAALVAIARAAHLAGDRELERAARDELLERFGMRLTFERTPPTLPESPNRNARG